MRIYCHCGRIMWIPMTAYLYPTLAERIFFRAFKCQHEKPQS